ncbi:GNAT family N-acetyltransferase [Sulfitobacter albidus]|uniref:GNAT family N-acetyltransferase n=1 Tax=Sulfitobacter albidus TaxID=2829501 RepID=A0A975PLM2_9RHOB|nr:GNAT family N-acetyltransferase [Sulfitobacter albidus]QUJ75873.1 GNAT family N-acetyltransferase [Sulfitobacter albidus]
MTTVRPILDTDLDPVLKMIHALAAHHGDAAVITKDTLARDALGAVPWLHVLVAEGARGLVGYAALCPLAQLQFGVRGMDMHHLFVAPDMRGRGLGRRLTQASVAHARDLGCRYLTVGTHPDNHGAAAAYRAMGFAARPAPGPRFSLRW